MTRMTAVGTPGTVTLVLAGSLDETAELTDLRRRAPAGKLVLDLAGVSFINSLGVRDWIRMQAAAQPAAASRSSCAAVAEPRRPPAQHDHRDARHARA